MQIGGEIIEPNGEDKGICSRRKIITRMDATELLRYFARMQALSVIHLNADLPDVVCDYLMTGDDDIRDAARDAAWAARAARDAAWAASWAAARDAASQHFNDLVHECFEAWL